MHRNLVEIMKPTVQPVQINAPTKNQNEARNKKYQMLQLRSNSLEPLRSKGKLVDDFALSPIEFTKDTYIDVKNITNALIKGDVGDYYLGRMNDLGMKIGGLAIATYLFSRRNTAASKKMEFVGFGAFFSSMVLVPKLLIEKPLQWMYGFNIHQKYEDSQGRKKMFFLDPQYLPWDIWDNRDINRIGDKMGVEKNINDREELIQRKMAKVALQGNTLWMLVAGFLTPLWTALFCNKFEEYFTPIFKNMHYDKILKEFSKIDEIASNAKEPKKRQILDKELENLVGKVLTEKDIDEIAQLISIKSEPEMNGVIKEHIRKMSKADNPIEKLSQNMWEVGKEFFERHDVTPQELKRIIKRNTEEGSTYNEILACIKDDIEELLRARTVIKGRSGLKILNELNQITELGKYRSNNKPFEVDDKKHLLEVFDKMVTLNSKYDTVGKFKRMVVGEIEDSILTDAYKYWADNMIKGLELDHKTIYELAQPETTTFKAISEIFASIAKDETRYLKFYTLLEDLQAPFNSQALGEILETLRGDVLNSLRKEYEVLQNELGIENIMDVYDRGKLRDGKDAPSSFIHNTKKQINEALDGFHSSMDRMYLALDLERRIHTGVLEEQFYKWKFGYNADQKPINGLIPKIDTDFEDFKKLARNLIYRYNFPDAANRFDIYQREHYLHLMQVVFNDKLDNLTHKALKLLSGDDDEKLKQLQGELAKLRESYYQLWSSTDSVSRPWDPITSSNATEVQKYIKTSGTIVDTVRDAAGRAYNSKAWKKTFILPTIGISVATVLSGFFFGKLKDENLYSKRGMNVKHK